MGPVSIGRIGLASFLNLLRSDFAVGRRHGNNLVSRQFNSSCFMSINMRRNRSNDTLIIFQGRPDNGEIGLRAADNETDGNILCFASLPDQFTCPLGMRITAVTGILLIICLRDGLQDLRRRAFQVITFKSNHSHSLLTYVGAGKALSFRHFCLHQHVQHVR